MSHRRRPQSESLSAISRRNFLKKVGIIGGGITVGSYLPRRQPVANAQEGTFQLKAHEPNPKHGGTLRYAVLSAPAHFDIHQSVTNANIGPQSPMYDTLIRRDPWDGQTIIPDLAYKWEIDPDNKTYTFYLRRGVKFHDGADFTAEDVKATFSRITWPPKGVVMPRAPLFAAVSEIRVLDGYRIQFRLREPRPTKFMLAAFASGWNPIVRKKSLEDNGYNLRQVVNYPGTGPFRFVSRRDKEVWILERNPNYWNKGLPYLDRMEIYHFLPYAPEMGAALLAGKLDYGRTIDPVSARKAKETPGLTSASYNNSTVQAVWFNTKKKPFGDPRVRRAMHLAVDRPSLVEVVKDVTSGTFGGFIYPHSEWATPPEELGRRLGYQADPKAAIQEARRLMAEAGYAKGLSNVDFLVREGPSWKLWAVAIQAMLKEALNIETKLRTIQVSTFFDDLQAGNFDLGIGAIVSTLADPSDYFNAWYGKDGPSNYSQWSNPAFSELVASIDRELHEPKRKALVRQAEAILEQDPPLLPVLYERHPVGWYTYVKGHNPSNLFGAYDVARWDVVWLDK